MNSNRGLHARFFAIKEEYLNTFGNQSKRLEEIHISTNPNIKFDYRDGNKLCWEKPQLSGNREIQRQHFCRYCCQNVQTGSQTTRFKRITTCIHYSIHEQFQPLVKHDLILD